MTERDKHLYHQDGPYVGQAKGHERARRHLARAVERLPPGWVSVDTRLPKCLRGRDDLGTQVLVWPHVDGSAVAFYGRRATGRPTFYLYGAVARVTHWMPLPEGPKS